MLTIENVTYAYPGHGEALRGLSCRVPDGLTLLAGANAGGKTTLLSLLAGLACPKAGRIVLEHTGAAADARELRRAGRMVMQDPEPQMLGARVGEDIMLGAAASSLGAAFAEEAKAIAGRMGLADNWHRPVDSLSHGQKRKLCLAHAVLAGPRLLLLDEPFAGLDYPSAIELRELIAHNRRDGLAQVVSTHDLEPLFDIADWMIVLADGRLAAEGKPADLRGRLRDWSVRPPGGEWE